MMLEVILLVDLMIFLCVFRAKPDTGPWKLDLSDRTFHTIMTHSGNRPLRKLMFEAFYGRASPTVDRLNRNVENIVEITRKRSELEI